MNSNCLICETFCLINETVYGRWVTLCLRTPRSVANRACYAVFCAVLASLQNVSRASLRHAGVISLFDREFVPGGAFPTEMSHRRRASSRRPAPECRARPFPRSSDATSAVEGADDSHSSDDGGTSNCGSADRHRLTADRPVGLDRNLEQDG
jgi:hypothetical protein